MLSFTYNGINDFLIGISNEILKNHVMRETRGFTCYEFPSPVCVKLLNPTDRYIRVDKRKWNWVLPHVELLWILSGRNDMELPGYYVKKLYDFSDDGVYMRAGYGPRLRSYNSNIEDYSNSRSSEDEKSDYKIVDQLQYVVEILRKDPYSRQASITIHDPIKDCYDNEGDLKKTKDQPCTRLLQFQINSDNKLDLTVYMRSNDIIWGASAVNIFNFTFIQEIVAQILNVDVGSYYHIANNMHFYSDHLSIVEELAKETVPEAIRYRYCRSITSLKNLDEKIVELSNFEHKLRGNNATTIPEFEDDLFEDWAKVFYVKNSGNAVRFSNPNLENAVRRK